MSKRKIIKIDEKKCNGCGLCMPNCPEGALQIIDKKARLISDLFCDGLGACIGHCPQGAITIEEREAQAYSERKVMENVVKQGSNVIRAHLEHLGEHGETKYLQEAIDFLKENKIEVPQLKDTQKNLPCGCPGSKVVDFRKEKARESSSGARQVSELGQWPIQLRLVPAFAPYLQNADLLIAADCVPFSYANFHADFLKGRTLLVGCPKFDDLDAYQEKISQIIEHNNLKSITYVHMEVPCCFGLIDVIREAIENSGKKVPFKEVTISISGEKLG